MEIFESSLQVRFEPTVLNMSTTVSGMPEPFLMTKVGRHLSPEPPVERPPDNLWLGTSRQHEPIRFPLSET